MPRKTVRQQRTQRGSTTRRDERNRLRPVLDNVNGSESSDQLWNEIEVALRSTATTVPIGGKYYTFIYLAATPELLTDRYPLVIVTNVYQWGFRGFNQHIGEYRNYNFNQLVSPLYQILTGIEGDTIEKIPYQKLEYSS